jgi:hypothetical protein
MTGFNLLKESALASWKIIQANLTLLSLFFLILTCTALMHSQLSRTTGQSFFVLMTFLIDFFIYYILAKTSLQLAKHEKVSLTALQLNLKEFLNYTLVTIIYVVLSIIGFFLLIFPGLFLATKYFFVGFYLLDKKSSLQETPVKSSQLTYKKQLLLIPTLIFSCIPILFTIQSSGLLDLLISLLTSFWTIFCTLISAYLYFKFLNNKV